MRVKPAYSQIQLMICSDQGVYKTQWDSQGLSLFIHTSTIKFRQLCEGISLIGFDLIINDVEQGLITIGNLEPESLIGNGVEIYNGLAGMIKVRKSNNRIYILFYPQMQTINSAKSVKRISGDDHKE